LGYLIKIDGHVIQVDSYQNRRFITARSINGRLTLAEAREVLAKLQSLELWAERIEIHHDKAKLVWTTL